MISFLYLVRDLITETLLKYKMVVGLPLEKDELQYLKAGDRVTIIEKRPFVVAQDGPIRVEAVVVLPLNTGRIKFRVLDPYSGEINLHTSFYKWDYVVIRRRKRP